MTRSVPDTESGWSFDRYRLIVGRGLFDAAGQEVPIAPKPLAVLVHLLRHHDRFVDRAELLAEVWRDVAVSDAAIASVLRDLRRALGETASDARILRTARGRGLSISVPVEVIGTGRATDAWDETRESLERALHVLETVDRQRGLARDPGERARADLRIALARVQWAGGATLEAREIFLEAATLGRSLGDASIFAQAALGYAGRTDVPTHLAAEALALLEEALALVPAEDLALASEIRSRLATELAIGTEVDRADALSGEGLALAERSRDPGAIAYALTARHFVLQRTGAALEDRLALSVSAQSWVEGRATSDVYALALQQEYIDRLEAGERERMDDVLARYEEAAASLGQPFFEWMFAVFSSARTLIDGRLDEAESQAVAARTLGERAGSPNADLAFAAQLLVIRRDQGRLAELLPLLEGLAEAFAGRGVVRAARTACVAEAGDDEATRKALAEATPGGVAAVPRDHDWLTTMALLTPVVARVGSDRERGSMRALLAPFGDRLFVAAHGVACSGAVSHGLGLLDRSLGREAEAEANFRRALARHERLRAPLWQAESARAALSVGGRTSDA